MKKRSKNTRAPNPRPWTVSNQIFLPANFTVTIHDEVDVSMDEIDMFTNMFPGTNSTDKLKSIYRPRYIKSFLPEMALPGSMSYVKPILTDAGLKKFLEELNPGTTTLMGYKHKVFKLSPGDLSVWPVRLTLLSVEYNAAYVPIILEDISRALDFFQEMEL